MKVPEFETTHSKRGARLMIGVISAMVIVAGIVLYSILIGK